MKGALAKLAMPIALAALLAIPAQAEIVQKGNLRVTVLGKLSPQRLPRTGLAPVAVSISGRVTTTDGSLAPQLKSMRIEFNRRGHLDTRGLPECHIGRIQPASTARALRACRPSLVGKGSFSVDVVLGTQEPYPTTGRLLVFNGRYKGRPALLGQIYSAHPFATSFVIPFILHPIGRGTYGTALVATLPKALSSWGHVTALEMRLARRYSYRGRRHSFISAGCPAPQGFGRALFSLARTSFRFAGGGSLRSTLTRSCRVRG